jgi:hypothetical protein
MKLGGSLGNVPQKLKKKNCYKNSIYFRLEMYFGSVPRGQWRYDRTNICHCEGGFKGRRVSLSLEFISVLLTMH